ncbi:unnamed protein product [Sphagnum troendelagicum]
MFVEVAPGGAVPSPEAAGEGTSVNKENSVRSKILSHFIKGKISLTPMETVLMILGELEHLESLVKLARRKKDAEAVNDQVSMVSTAPTLEDTPLNGGWDVDFGKLSLGDPIMTGQTDTMVLDSDTDIADDCEGGHQLVESIDDEPEFGNTGLENLVLVEGPQ